MATKTTMPPVWHVPDDLWSFISVLFEPDWQPGDIGRRRTPARVIFEAVFYRLRTGCQWHAIPRAEFAPGTTVYTRYRKWVAQGIWQQAWQMVLGYYDAVVGIAWRWQALDGCITKAPLGQDDTGPSPVDRAKGGTKRSVLTDGRGAPLAIEVAGANRPDKCLAQATLDGIVVERPQTRQRRTQHLCLDKGYDYQDVINAVIARLYILHLKQRGQDDNLAGAKRYPARRWVVERTHSWFNRFRALLVRWEKKTENYKALLHLAATYIVYCIVKHELDGVFV